MKRKRYSRKFQRMAVERMRSSDNIGDLVEELGIGRRVLYKWRTKLDHLEPGEEAPRTNSHESSHRQQVHQLKRLLAEKSAYSGHTPRVARLPEVELNSVSCADFKKFIFGSDHY